MMIDRLDELMYKSFMSDKDKSRWNNIVTDNNYKADEDLQNLRQKKPTRIT